MARWSWRRWAWAVAMGAACIGAAAVEADETPQPGTSIVLKFPGQTDRTMIVVKSTRQKDGSIETEVKDSKTGEVIKLLDFASPPAPAVRPFEPVPVPTSVPVVVPPAPIPVRAPAAPPRLTPPPTAAFPALPPVSSQPGGSSAFWPNPVAPTGPSAQRMPTPSAPRQTFTEVPNAPSASATPMPPAEAPRDRRLFNGRLFHREPTTVPKVPAAAAATPPTVRPKDEDEKRGLFSRIFGKKPAPPAMPATSLPPSSTPAFNPSPAFNPTPTFNPSPAFNPTRAFIPSQRVNSEPPRIMPSRPMPVAPPAPERIAPVPPPKPAIPTPAPLIAPSAPIIPNPLSAIPVKPVSPPLTSPLPNIPPVPMTTSRAVPKSGPVPSIAAHTLVLAPSPAPIAIAPKPPVRPAAPVAVPRPIPAPAPVTVVKHVAEVPRATLKPSPVVVAPVVRPAVAVRTIEVHEPVPMLTRSPLERRLPGEIQPFAATLGSALSPSKRIMAATALAQCRHGSTENVKAVLFQSAVGDPCPAVRASCIEHLCKLGYFEPAFMSHLKAASRDSSEEVRTAAKTALERMSPR